jgi:hypothetical protein
VTGGDGALSLNLYVFMLCVLVGMGGMLKVMGGKLSGYMAIGVAMAVHVVNCASIALFFQH